MVIYLHSYVAVDFRVQVCAYFRGKDSVRGNIERIGVVEFFQLTV